MRTTEPFRTIGRAIEELHYTILRGWPSSWEWPTEQEAEQIEEAHNEILLHLPEVGEERAWYIAGNIIARFRRDVVTTPQAP